MSEWDLYFVFFTLFRPELFDLILFFIFVMTILHIVLGGSQRSPEGGQALSEVVKLDFY